MARSFGNGQTNGLPLLITGITLATAQLLHTAPAGAATPNVIQVFANNLDQANGHTVTVVISDAGGTNTRSFTQVVPVDAGLFPIFEDGYPIVLNGACTVKVFADALNAICVTAVAEDQSSVAGAVSQNIGSGLVAAVQNASRFAVGAQGGTGQATETNASIAVSRAGILRNLGAKASAAVGGGATVTVSVFKNGVITAQVLTLANADGTTWKQTAGAAVAVVAGDLISFSVACDNAGAPAANIEAAVEFV